jgi:hypothetical protein
MNRDTRAMIYKTLPMKLKMEQHGSHTKPEDAIDQHTDDALYLYSNVAV